MKQSTLANAAYHSRIDSERCIKNYSKIFAKDDFKEFSKLKIDQLVYAPSKESFLHLLKTLGKTATQMFWDRATEAMETFLLGKLPLLDVPRC